MKFVEQLQLLDRLHALIQRKGTGNYQHLAARLGVAPRTVYNLLDALKELGAKIDYCKTRQSYYYANDIELDFSNLLNSRISS